MTTHLQTAADDVTGVRTRPTPGGARFLRNAWYAAAWSGEVGEAPFRRILLDEPIVLFRRERGDIAALTDRCPHRFAPLSLGTRQGDTLQCPYHGLVFDSGGRCISSPFTATPPKGAAVRAWPVVERHGAIWLWPGEADAAEEALIPDFDALRCPSGSQPIGGHLHSRANYEYLTDNLMDLSHVEFVHRGTFGADGLLFSGEHTLRQDGDTVYSDWSMPDTEMPGWAFWRYPPGTRADQWLNMRWDAPGLMRLEIGATEHGTPRDQGYAVVQAHLIAPETADTAHYLWATTRFSPAPPTSEADDFLRARNLEAFAHQDKPLIEAAYRNFSGDFWAQRPVFMGVDAGATTVRRILEKRIAAEDVARGG